MMSTRILAVHLTRERLCLASAESSLRGLRADAIVEVERDRAMTLGRLLPGRSWDRVLATVPADAGAFRFLRFAFRDRRRVQQAVGPALEEHIPLALEACSVAWDFASSRRDAQVLGVMLPREALDRQREQLATFDVKPQRLVWAPSAILEFYRCVLAGDGECSIIDLSRDGAAVATLSSGTLSGLRWVGNGPDAALLRNTAWALRSLAPAGPRVVVGGSRVRDLAPALAEMLSEFRLEALPEACPVTLAEATAASWTAAAPALGLLLLAHGRTARPAIEWPATQTAPSSAPAVAPEWRALVPWAALAGVLALTAGVTDDLRLAARKRALDRRAEAVFRRVMPAGQGTTGRRLKLEMRLRELEAQNRQARGVATVASPLAVLVAMSKAVPPDLDVEFDSYSFAPPDIRLSGHGASFETATRVQRLLESGEGIESVEVRDVHAAVDGEGVDFRIHIRLARSEGEA